jgi:rSAM-partnered protein
MTDPNVMRVDEPRGDGTPEWEVFLREDPADPLRHVGSVSAPTASVAYDHASSLFGWAADTLWLCPAAEVARFTDRDLGTVANQDDGAATGREGDTEATPAGATGPAEAAGGSGGEGS